MKPAKMYDEIVNNMPAGLERAVISAVRFHVGKDQAIQKPALLRTLRDVGFGKEENLVTFERKVRLAIVAMRKAGVVICSSSGDGGYYVPACWAEYNEFEQVEYIAKIRDMSETTRAMASGASRMFGPRPVPQGQGSLF